MNIIEHYEGVCTEPDDLFDKMRRISIIESASEELSMSLELHPDTEKELNGIGINPKNFVRRFQETDNDY